MFPKALLPAVLSLLISATPSYAHSIQTNQTSWIQYGQELSAELLQYFRENPRALWNLVAGIITVTLGGLLFCRGNVAPNLPVLRNTWDLPPQDGARFGGDQFGGGLGSSTKALTPKPKIFALQQTPCYARNKGLFELVRLRDAVTIESQIDSFQREELRKLDMQFGMTPVELAQMRNDQEFIDLLARLDAYKKGRQSPLFRDDGLFSFDEENEDPNAFVIN